MIQPARRIQETSRDIVGLQIREVAEDLLTRLAGGQELQHVNHAQAHAADAWAAFALLWTDSDSLKEVSRCHDAFGRGASKVTHTETGVQ